MEHLFSDWKHIVTSLKNASHVVLLMDYDGTLTPIMARPDLAVFSENMRNLLQDLTQKQKMTIGLISGRSLIDLKNIVGINGIIYAGNHGLEIEGPQINYVYPVAEDIKYILYVLNELLNKTLSSVSGVIVENKGLTLSVHYRQVDADRVNEVKNICSKVVSGLYSIEKIKITYGKKVIELKPAVKWNKGKAVQLIMKKYGNGGRYSGLLPVYLGDDETDEDAFKQTNKYNNGIAVFVGEEHQLTAADYFLNSTNEVAHLLNNVLDVLRKDHD